jgi:hypothetical protein
LRGRDRRREKASTSPGTNVAARSSVVPNRTVPATASAMLALAASCAAISARACAKNVSAQRVRRIGMRRPRRASNRSLILLHFRQRWARSWCENGAVDVLGSERS